MRSDLDRRLKVLERVDGACYPALGIELEGVLCDPVTLAPLTEHQVHRLVAIVPDVDRGSDEPDAQEDE